MKVNVNTSDKENDNHITNKNEKQNYIPEETVKSIEQVSVKKIEYDDIVTAAGEFGTFQVLLFFATCPLYVFGSYSYFAQLFMTEVPGNYWCWIPELKNLSQLERRSLAIPQIESERFGYSHCRSYVADWHLLIDSEKKLNSSWPTESCRHGWEYNTSEIPYPTISTEMNWVCEKNSYQATAQALFFMGSILGGFIIGWIADRFGRIPAGVISNIIGCTAGAASVFARNFAEFGVCRFIMGMSYDNSMMMIFLLTLEYVSPKYRTVLANLSSGFFYTLGLITLPWIALLCGNWKLLCLVTSLPMAISAITIYLIPESPRWLLSKGRIEESIKKIVSVGKLNKKEIPTQLIHQFKSESLKSKINENSSIFEIFKRPILRCALLSICLNYMCCTIIFDALVRSIGSLSFDIFLSFTIVSLSELPSLLIVSFALDITGRKWLTILVLFMCCIFSILIPFVKNGLTSVICAVVARFGLNIAYMVALQWVAEILPTPVRGSGTSFMHICGYVATVVSPYIVYTENYIPGLPLVIVGIIAFIGACSVINLPETAGLEMPQTFEESDDMIKSKKFFDIPFLRK